MSKSNKELATEIVIEWMRLYPAFRKQDGSHLYNMPNLSEVVNNVLLVEKHLSSGQNSQEQE